MKNPLKNKYIRHILLIGIFYGLVMVAVFYALRVYTRHGEKLQMPDLQDYQVSEALSLSKEKTFDPIVEDSIFIVGVPGGQVLSQNPVGGSFVKRNRKVYLTISKYQADMISVAQLPKLYGRDFARKQNELFNSFSIESEIKDYEYDQGEPDQILRVLYDGKEIISSNGRSDEIKIEKGATLQFILSKNTEGTLYMPDVTCKTYDEAIFYLTNLGLEIGEVNEDGFINHKPSAFVYDQYPAARSNMLTGDTVELFITSERPASCPE